MKNPHGVEPTQFMKRKESDDAIIWNFDFGPKFSGDIHIGEICNNRQHCFIHNDGTFGYECHPKYKSSLFVNTAGPEEWNNFSVLDFEVYYNVESYKEFIYTTFKYPDIIWKYIETKDISEESLKQFDDDVELLNDLDAIHCNDSSIRLKISSYYFKNPSEFLPNTQLVNQQYDGKLREWLGDDYKWKLIYRASEHEYTAKSFHNYCDNKEPTLIVIKSSGGWIFGGYTTQSWKPVFDIYNNVCIYYDMIYDNQ